MKALWVERYRPKKIEDYVFKDQRLRDQVEGWIRDNDIQHILLHGPAGTGKSSLISVLLNTLNISEGDQLYLNCSDITGVEDIRKKVTGFVSTVPNGDYKIVIMEEADYLSPNAQGIMRRIMEDYAAGARFILTCNYVNKIKSPIRSRCKEVEIKRLDQDEFIMRVATILDLENVEFDALTLEAYVSATYPDLRKCINNMQGNVHDGVLLPIEDEDSTADWQIQAADLFNQGKITEGRKLVCSQIRPEQADDFFAMCYRNLHWWSDEPIMQDLAIVIIRDAIVKNSSVADVEINIAATLVELAKIHRGEI